MGKPTGFKEFDREVAPYRDAAERLVDFKEIYTDHNQEHLQTQGSRCMDCGVPFCQSGNGCPIHNLIPEWNDLVYKGRWREALDDALRHIREFSPQHLVVSLGVDTFEHDPISFFKLTTPDYLTTGQLIGALGIPTLFVMEGGYDIGEVGLNVVNVLNGFEH